MNFKRYFEENSVYQTVFPFLSEEPPPDKGATGYKSKEDYIRSAIQGARKTEIAAEKLVSARYSSWTVGQETLLELINKAVIVPAQNKNPEFPIAIAHVKGEEKLPNDKSRFRILAFWQGKKDLNSVSDLDPIGGIIHIGGYITDVWVHPAWRGKDKSGFSLYKELRKFASKRGIVGLAPDDTLTSKSFRASQAKYDYRRAHGEI